MGELNPNFFKNIALRNISFLPQLHPTYTPPNPKTHPIKIAKSMKEKASKTTRVAKEPLTSHVHHVKMQNKYNTNLDVYSNFGFFCTTK